MVIWVEAREEKETSKGESFLQIHGVDMDGHSIGPLRLWRFVTADMEALGTYIVRGLKVVSATYWCHIQYKYVPAVDGRKALECSWRSALENVSDEQAITSCFV